MWKFRSPHLGKAQQLQEQCYPFLSACVVFSCVQIMLWLPVFGIWMCAQVLMHVIAHGGCMDTVRESALGADSGREIPCRTWDSNPPQYCTWLFCWTLYKQSYSCPSKSFTCFCLLVVCAFLVFFWGAGVCPVFSTETLPKSTEKMCLPAIHLC